MVGIVSMTIVQGCFDFKTRGGEPIQQFASVKSAASTKGSGSLSKKGSDGSKIAILCHLKYHGFGSAAPTASTNEPTCPLATDITPL
jgi:hypothetical protein